MRSKLANVALVLFGLGLGAVVVLVAVPNATRWLNPELTTLTYRLGDGDIFHVQPNTIEPPDDPNRVLSRFRIGWGAWGYREPLRPAAAYSMVVLGDSFTEGQNVAAPYPDLIAGITGEPVRNMGFPGYGVQEYALAMEAYGTQLDPDVVVVGFFAANDIAFAYERDVKVNNVREDAVGRVDEPEAVENVDYPFPVQVRLEGRAYDVAFLFQYLWWINAEPDPIRESANMEIVRESLEVIADAAGDACRVLVYVPSKGEVYLPFLSYADRLTLLDRTSTPVRGDDGVLEMQDEPNGDVDTVMQRRGNLQAVMREVAEEEGFHFLDLTPAFEAAAEGGAMLYYAYDTHWNQAGHNLAATTIADGLSVCGL